MITQNRPVSGSLGFLADVKKYLELIEIEAGEIKRNLRDGTATGDDQSGNNIFRAIRKGEKKEPWILIFKNSPHIEWIREFPTHRD